MLRVMFTDKLLTQYVSFQTDVERAFFLCGNRKEKEKIGLKRLSRLLYCVENKKCFLLNKRNIEIVQSRPNPGFIPMFFNKFVEYT